MKFSSQELQYILGCVASVFVLIYPTASTWQGTSGITVKKTNQALIFGLYDEPMTPGQCNMIVEKLGDYLIDQGM